jgi:flavorubredoxin
VGPRKIKEGIYWTGAIDWDRRLFDALIPLPSGTSYNSYLVEGSDKTALIDTVDPSMQHILFSRLEGVDAIDYIIIQHVEQDHSGTLPFLLEKYPQAQVLVSKTGHEMLVNHLHVAEEKVKAVEDGAEISLGDRTLKFIYTPWVHWPETMSTYLKEDEILFSCDFFGSHLATSDLFATDWMKIYPSAKRYYAEIMMPLRNAVLKDLEKIKDYEIRTIAPSHGPIHDKPELIVDAYREWISGKPKNRAVLAYVSMHDSTKLMVEHLNGALMERGVSVDRFHLDVTDLGEMATALVDAGTIVIGTPTVLTGPHPTAAHAAFITNMLRPKAEFAAIMGSYGWMGKTEEVLTQMMSRLKVELLDSVMCKGLPRAEDYTALDKLADTIAQKHKEHGFP